MEDAAADSVRRILDALAAQSRSEPFRITLDYTGPLGWRAARRLVRHVRKTASGSHHEAIVKADRRVNPRWIDLSLRAEGE